MKHQEDDLNWMIALLAAALFVVVVLCSCRQPKAIMVERAEAPQAIEWRKPPATNRAAARWSELSDEPITNSPVCADGFQKK